LSPQGVQGIDAFETPPVSWQSVPGADEADKSPSIGTLQQQMLNYMDLEAPGVLRELENQYGVQLADEHRSRVLQDVKRQLKERVHYYAKTAPYPANGTEEEQRKWSLSVIEKTTRDVGAAFRAYLAGLKNGSSGAEGEGK
jgi:spore germination protein PC